MELTGYVLGRSPSPDWQLDLDGVLLAQHAIINGITQNISLIEVFTEFRPMMLPFQAVFFVVLGLRGVREATTVHLTFSQGSAWSQELEFEVPSPVPPDPVQLTAAQIVVTLVDEEDLVVAIHQRGTEIGIRRFPVTVPRPATLPAPADIKG